ncbi:MAG: hypothetical protein Q7T03_10495 [Deltaproteobacteria bacterium]|nr:hypothetical protein [Deltaproteobacteria bacterium]
MTVYTSGEEKFEVEFKKEGVSVNGRETARGVTFEQLPGEGLLIKLGDSALPAFVCVCWLQLNLVFMRKNAIHATFNNNLIKEDVCLRKQ